MTAALDAAVLEVDRAVRAALAGRAVSHARRAALEAALARLRLAVAAPLAGDVTARQLVEAWVEAGGDWRELVAAVNQLGRAGVPQRASHTHPEETAA